MKITADVVDYMGTYMEGVLVLLVVGVDEEYTEATLYYNDSNLLLTVDESVEKATGGRIEDWPGYRNLLESVLSRLLPCSEVFGQLEPVDFEKYLTPPKENYINEELDPDEIIVATQSNL